MYVKKIFHYFSCFVDVKRACELLEKLQKSKYCGEVPATKLAALQKVLQSEFLNAVREVYEHVYETVDVQGNPEIRASATAKVRKSLCENCRIFLALRILREINYGDWKTSETAIL